MITKLIKATCKPDCREAFLERQRVWNDAMARQPGFTSFQVAVDIDDSNLIYIVINIQSRAYLDRFMANEHELLANETAMSQLCERLEVSILENVDPLPPQVRLDVAAVRTSSGHQISALSELYRISMALRAGVLSGLFDAIGRDGATLERLAHDLRVGAPRLGRLMAALAAIDLLAVEGDTVRLEPIAARHLLKSADGYVGHLVLHNTRPALWRRWGELHEELALPQPNAVIDDDLQFLRAMSDVATAGQAKALLAAVDLSERVRLLDVGGALGDYAFALCRAYPGLGAVVFDRPMAEAGFRQKLAQSVVGERVAFAGGDYRAGLPAGPFDCVLLSNVLRGEVVADARALLERIYAALCPNGLLLVQDAFVDDEAGRGPLLPTLFGLHLPDAMNGSVQAVGALLSAVGFQVAGVRPLDGYVVANRLLLAERP